MERAASASIDPASFWDAMETNRAMFGRVVVVLGGEGSEIASPRRVSVSLVRPARLRCKACSCCVSINVIKKNLYLICIFC